MSKTLREFRNQATNCMHVSQYFEETLVACGDCVEVALREAVREERAVLRAPMEAAKTKLDNPPGISFREMARLNCAAWKILFDALAALDARDAETKEGCAWCKNPMPHEHER